MPEPCTMTHHSSFFFFFFAFQWYPFWVIFNRFEGLSACFSLIFFWHTQPFYFIIIVIPPPKKTMNSSNYSSTYGTNINIVSKKKFACDGESLDCPVTGIQTTPNMGTIFFWTQSLKPVVACVWRGWEGNTVALWARDAKWPTAIRAAGNTRCTIPLRVLSKGGPSPTGSLEGGGGRKLDSPNGGKALVLAVKTKCHASQVGSFLLSFCWDSCHFWKIHVQYIFLWCRKQGIIGGGDTTWDPALLARCLVDCWYCVYTCFLFQLFFLAFLFFQSLWRSEYNDMKSKNKHTRHQGKRKQQATTNLVEKCKRTSRHLPCTCYCPERKLT